MSYYSSVSVSVSLTGPEVLILFRSLSSQRPSHTLIGQAIALLCERLGDIKFKRPPAFTQIALTMLDVQVLIRALRWTYRTHRLSSLDPNEPLLRPLEKKLGQANQSLQPSNVPLTVEQISASV